MPGPGESLPCSNSATGVHFVLLRASFPRVCRARQRWVYNHNGAHSSSFLPTLTRIRNEYYTGPLWIILLPYEVMYIFHLLVWIRTHVLGYLFLLAVLPYSVYWFSFSSMDAKWEIIQTRSIFIMSNGAVVINIYIKHFLLFSRWVRQSEASHPTWYGMPAFSIIWGTEAI